LMTKHRIELADLEAITPGSTEEPLEEQDLFAERSRIPWKVSLAAGIAKANGCMVYTQRHNKRANDRFITRYIGTRSSMATVRYMYAYLVREIDRLASLNREGRDRTWLTSFRLGAVATITTRLLETVKREESHASSTALVVINKDLARVKSRIDSLGLKSAPRHQINDSDGFTEGVRAGRTVNLSNGPGLPRGAKADLPK
jgi:hypothetical protein